WWLVLGQPLGLLGLYAVLVQLGARELTGEICLAALLGIELVGGMIGALIVTAAAVHSDVKQRTLESLKLSSLTPVQLVLGKLLGEPAAIYLSVWATMPLAAVCGVAAGFPLGWVLLAYLNISALVLLAGCLGLMQPLESRSERPGAVSAAHGIMG